MTLRSLPAIRQGRRSDVESVVTVNAFQRWCPEVQAAAASQDEASISILDVIGQDFWSGEGVTVKRVDAALRSIGERDVVVNINSPGGDYFEGLAIYNRLREHKAKVTVKVLGMAASAASVIMMAGDEVKIARAAFVMIHNTWVVAMGDRHALREVADWLEPFDAAAADIYAARTKLDAKEIAKMLDRETWIGGADAVAKGFADALLDDDEVVDNAQAGTKAKQGALQRVEFSLARCGVPRAERRKILKDLTSGMPSAADEVMPSADLAAEVQGFLSHLKSL